MSWDAIQKGPGGSVQYTVGRGWFDLSTCKAGIDSRVTTKAQAVIPGLLYAFRSCGTTCHHDESFDSVPLIRSTRAFQLQPVLSASARHIVIRNVLILPY